MTQREILVTHALPYANGPLHIGHLLGYIQSDIWVRARRMAGDTVHFVAADDVHGTPIMLAAEKAGMAPEEFIKGMQVSHERDFADFGVAHDYYYTTHSRENQELAELVYKRLRDAKPSHIATKNVRQFYDPVKQMFLPDRYIKGECPNCGTPDQYGDNCENCGATYAPTDLKNPRSVVSGATPELRDSEHYFFKLGDFTEFLRDWFAGKLTNGEPVAHPSVAAKLKEWLDAEGGLRDWDISRDAPYFGFPIPDAPGKFFYVWLDAPIGYLASFKKYCASEQGAARGLTATSFDEFMQIDDAKFDRNAEMHHFIGKDIINFHGLFWPAMLKGARLRTPNKLYVNGYLTVNGEKMSKSRGTFIQARTYLDAGLNPDYLRYYFATMLGPEPVDVDLDLKIFGEVVNSHIVGKLVNVASRCAQLLAANFGGNLSQTFPCKDVLVALEETHASWPIAARDYRKRVLPQLAENPPPIGTSDLKSFSYDALESLCEFELLLFPEVLRAYAQNELFQVVRALMTICESINGRLQQWKPWVYAKSEVDEEKTFAHQVLTYSMQRFWMVICFFSPVVPQLASISAAWLGQPLKSFSDSFKPLPDILRPYAPIATRIDAKQIETMVDASKESLQSVSAAAAPPSPQPSPASGRGGKSSGAPGTSNATTSVAPAPAAGKAEPASPGSASSSSASAPSPATPVSIEDFARLDLRIGTVLQCEFVDGSDKLLRFELDAGELGKRQIFSGIRAAYQEPAKLIGRKVVFIANLAPRKMRFGVSEGMILSAGSGGDQLFLLDVDDGAGAGMPVK